MNKDKKQKTFGFEKKNFQQPDHQSNSQKNFTDVCHQGKKQKSLPDNDYLNGDDNIKKINFNDGSSYTGQIINEIKIGKGVEKLPSKKEFTVIRDLQGIPCSIKKIRPEFKEKFLKNIIEKSNKYATNLLKIKKNIINTKNDQQCLIQ